MLTPLTHQDREKIRMYVKNKIDISPLIENKNIKGEDLSFAIIKKMTRIEENLQDINFAKCTIGDENSIISILRCNLKNCNFEGTKFIGKTWMRSCNAQNCNFKNADVSLVSYQHTDFRGSSFCNSKITIGTKEGIGCKFPKEMFYDLCKGWDMTIEVKDKGE